MGASFDSEPTLAHRMRHHAGDADHLYGHLMRAMADDIERYERLSAALTIAQQSPPAVDTATAGEWLERQLGSSVDPQVLTVIWQSVTRLYWSADEVTRVSGVIEAAATLRPIAHVSMEYPTVDEVERRDQAAELSVSWSAGRARPVLYHERLATVGDHGFPVTLLS